jgi:predicted transcriptional regulator YheO
MSLCYNISSQNLSQQVVEMQTVQTTTELTAKQKIDLLAQENNLERSHSQLDEIGAMFSRLSDNEVELDRTQWILVELNRAGILTGKDNTLLHAQYLQERDP